MKGQGYLAFGMEPDLAARERAIADQSVDVMPSLDLVPSNEQFHVVTMWHVLEHVPDIRRTFKKLYSVMADGGFLFIAVPDHESWDAQHYGPDWAAYDVPRHLNHFRRRDLDRLFREHGFVLMATKHMWFDAYYIAMLSERYRGRGNTSALFMGILFGLWSNLKALVSSSPTSSTLYVAKKQEP
jgi:SAM-dependent methyltransferase